MPLLKELNFSEGTFLSIWKIEETTAEEFTSFPFFRKEAILIVSEQKRKEFLAVRAAALACWQKTENQNPFRVEKDEFGKPHLPDHPEFHLSFTHSFPYAACILSQNQKVGIDLEKPREQILKIRKRVFSEQEIALAGTNLLKNMQLWCAKEAAYKWYGKKGLDFTEQIKIDSLDNRFSGKVITTEKAFKLEFFCLQYEEFILVYCSEFPITNT